MIVHSWKVKPDYRWFDCYFFVTGPQLSLGIHIDPVGPFVEVHLPCGYFRVGFLYRKGREQHVASPWAERRMRRRTAPAVADGENRPIPFATNSTSTAFPTSSTLAGPIWRPAVCVPEDPS